MSLDDEISDAGRTAAVKIGLLFGTVMHVIVGALTFLGGKLSYVWLPLWFLGLVGIVRYRDRALVVLFIPWVVLAIMFATAIWFGEWAGIRNS